MKILEKYPNSSFLSRFRNNLHLPIFTDRLNELYDCFRGLEDPHFEKQLDQDPNARLWEMMVAKIVKDAGHTPTSKHNGPDFCIHSTPNVFIEATCPGPGNPLGNPDSIPPLNPDNKLPRKVPIDKIVMRITGALHEKKKIIDNYISNGIINKGDACIIAISSSKLEGGKFTDPPIPFRATLGFGDAYTLYDKYTGARVGEGVDYKGYINKRNSVTSIVTTPFLSKEYKNISALLYSDALFFSHEYDLNKNSVLIHNPSATVPLKPHLFPNVREFWTIKCEEMDSWKPYSLNK